MRPLRWCWPPPAAAARVGASRRASTARKGGQYVDVSNRSQEAASIRSMHRSTHLAMPAMPTALSSTGDDTVDVCIVGGGAVGSSIAYHAATLLPPVGHKSVHASIPPPAIAYSYSSAPFDTFTPTQTHRAPASQSSSRTLHTPTPPPRSAPVASGNNFL